MKWKKLNLQLFADAHEQLQNTTGSSGMSAEMKTFYERRLIDQALPALVHDQFGDSYPIPANNGKIIEFRKYDALPKATTPLTEGVTPEGQALTVTTVTAEVHQYGGWVPLTDMVQMTTIDNNVVQATSVLASQSGRTMDTIVRDILAGGTIFEGMQKQALQMAKAAAGDEARAAEVEKGMQGVQKVQRQEFARRLAANQRTETRSAVKIDGKTFTNLGDVNEYITYQREEFRRQLKQQEQRLKAQRQEDMDAAKLWYKERMGELREENDYLADQVKQEQRRADRAERSLMIQDNEIMEWEAENERRREAWQQKQAQRNAIALEVARQQRDEDIAVAKKVAENRVQRARDARKADELKRSIRANAAQLNQMVLRPQKGKYVQKGLIVEAAEVAKLANLVTLNSKAVNQLTRLQDSITASMGSEGAPNAMTEDWKQSKVPELIQTLREDLTAAKNARLDKLHEQLAQAEALPDSEKARALQDRLKARIRDTENRVSLPMTVDQLRLLKAITSSTLHVIRTENKTLSLAKAEEVSAIADAAAYEVKTSKA